MAAVPESIVYSRPRHRLCRLVRTRPSVDLAAMSLVTGSAFLASQHWAFVLDNDVLLRRATYQTLAGLSGTLLGLSVTTVGLLLANLDKPMSGLPKGLPPTSIVALRRSLFSLIRALGYVCLLALALIPLDTGPTTTGMNGTEPWRLRWVLAGLVLLAVMRLSRAVYSLWLIVAGRATAQ